MNAFACSAQKFHALPMAGGFGADLTPAIRRNWLARHHQAIHLGFRTNGRLEFRRTGQDGRWRGWTGQMSIKFDIQTPRRVDMNTKAILEVSANIIVKRTITSSRPRDYLSLNHQTIPPMVFISSAV
jgi:hypothetical protein